MKKTIQDLLNDNKLQTDSTTENIFGGFASITGGFQKSTYINGSYCSNTISCGSTVTNSSHCTNETSCSGTNTSDCTNRTNCDGSTNGGCSNPVICAMM